MGEAFYLTKSQKFVFIVGKGGVKNVSRRSKSSLEGYDQ